MKSSGRAFSRRGIVMMASLVIVSLIALSAAIFSQEQLRLRRQGLRESYAHQAQWLAEGAFERAQAAAAKDANYTGETWNVTVDHAGEKLSGEALIEVVQSDDSDSEKLVRIEARFPLDPHFGVRHQFNATLSSKVSRP